MAEEVVEGGLEQIQAGIEFAIKLLLEGNQAEVEAETDKKRTVDATVTIPGATKKYEGNHIGQRQCKLLKYKCMSCLCPVYELVANGEGQFDGMDDQKNQVH